MTCNLRHPVGLRHPVPSQSLQMLSSIHRQESVTEEQQVNRVVTEEQQVNNKQGSFAKEPYNQWLGYRRAIGQQGGEDPQNGSSRGIGYRVAKTHRMGHLGQYVTGQRRPNGPLDVMKHTSLEKHTSSKKRNTAQTHTCTLPCRCNAVPHHRYISENLISSVAILYPSRYYAAYIIENKRPPTRAHAPIVLPYPTIPLQYHTPLDIMRHISYKTRDRPNAYMHPLPYPSRYQEAYIIQNKTPPKRAHAPIVLPYPTIGI